MIFSPDVCYTTPSFFVPCMIVVQARLGSTRLPGKIFKEVLGKPLLSYQLERLRRVKNVHGIVVATTTNPNDQKIVDFCDREGVHCIRGSEEDVLSRYVAAIDAFGLEVVVRVTSDCPLIDPDLLDKGMSCFWEHYEALDYLSICHKRTFAHGMDFEIVRAESLKKAFYEATESYDKEHVTPYIWKHPELFRLANMQQLVDQSKYRLTVDTQEDFVVIKKLLEELYPKKPEFTMQDCITLMDLYDRI